MLERQFIGGPGVVLVPILTNSPNLAQMLSIPYLIILRSIIIKCNPLSMPRLAPHGTEILCNMSIWLPPKKTERPTIINDTTFQGVSGS